MGTVDRNSTLQRILSREQAHRAAFLLHAANRCFDCQAAVRMRLRCHTLGATAILAASRGPRQRTLWQFARDTCRPESESRIVVVYHSRRFGVERFDRGIASARREDP